VSENLDRESTETTRRPGVAREVVSLCAAGAGLAGAVVCLAHLGWWMAGFSLAVLVLVLGVLGASARPVEEGPLRHVIEVRHTDGAPDQLDKPS